MHTKHFITVNVKYGVYCYDHEIAVQEDGTHWVSLGQLVHIFNGPYQDEILLNGEVVEGGTWDHILQDGDAIEGRSTPEGNAARAERRRLEEERLRNRPLKQKISDGFANLMESIFNPFGM